MLTVEVPSKVPSDNGNHVFLHNRSRQQSASALKTQLNSDSGYDEDDFLGRPLSNGFSVTNGPRFDQSLSRRT